jgi:dienelactone hydrolase
MGEIKAVTIPLGQKHLNGDLTLPAEPQGLVIFAHGSGSSRKSSRNIFVAEQLSEAGLATLLMDLLTPAEERMDLQSRELRFDIELLTGRVVAALDWAREQQGLRGLRTGIFGASTGAAAALKAAAARPEAVHAVVSRGGRPDLASESLQSVQAPTLLIVGEEDTPVIPLNRSAFDALKCQKHLELIPGATHLFEEPGGLEAVARHATRWFLAHLGTKS